MPTWYTYSINVISGKYASVKRIVIIADAIRWKILDNSPIRRSLISPTYTSLNLFANAGNYMKNNKVIRIDFSFVTCSRNSKHRVISSYYLRVCTIAKEFVWKNSIAIGSAIKMFRIFDANSRSWIIKSDLKGWNFHQQKTPGMPKTRRPSIPEALEL